MDDTGNKGYGSDWTAFMPKQAIPAVNLLTPQLGAAAAVSALGLGIASQMWGFWAGAVAGAFDASAYRLGKSADVGAAPAVADVDALKTIIRNKRADAPAQTVVVRVKPAEAAVIAKPATEFAAVAPARADDLKRISGVGPKLEQVLNGMGIRTYAQIAAWTADEIAKVDDVLKFGGRIVRDDWIGQASRLNGETLDK